MTRNAHYDVPEPCHCCGAMPANPRTGLCRHCDDGGDDVVDEDDADVCGHGVSFSEDCEACDADVDLDKREARLTMADCEWNPWTGAPAQEGDEPHGDAVWSVGTGDRNIHLCERCATLPVFKRLRSRARLDERDGHRCKECSCEDDGALW